MFFLVEENLFYMNLQTLKLQFFFLSETNQFGQDVETKITLSQFIDKVKEVKGI
jgi:hypothetical protein